MSGEKLDQQIKTFLNQKLGSKWLKSYSKKPINNCSSIRFICSKMNTGCKSSCLAKIDKNTNIASIYWNQMEHLHI